MNLLRPILDPIFKRFFPPVEPLPVGVYTYQAPADAPFPYRLHLRIEPDGSGLLILNASTVVHLNHTAAEYTYHLVKNTPPDQTAAEMARRYRVSKETVRQDYKNLLEQIQTLVDTPDLDPVTYLNFDRTEPYSGAISAPYRIDCALTYQLPEDGSRSLAPADRVKGELVEEEWISIMDKAWQAGVPQVIFTGGEPTLRPDLCSLVAHAESLGMVAGLITNGLRLSETHYLHDLLQSGLDHVMMVLDPEDEQSVEALRDVLAEDIAVVVHLTITRHNREKFTQILDQMASMGVQSISLSADSADLKDELIAQRHALADRHIHLVWDLPVPYSHFHPVAVEMTEEPDPQLTGVGQAWLYVEPDGDVLPGQGHYQDVLGNLVLDSWESVWQKAKAWKASH